MFLVCKFSIRFFFLYTPRDLHACITAVICSGRPSINEPQQSQSVNSQTRARPIFFAGIKERENSQLEKFQSIFKSEAEKSVKNIKIRNLMIEKHYLLEEFW